MKRFKHYDACTLDEAVSLLKEFDGKANIIAGAQISSVCLKIMLLKVRRPLLILKRYPA